MDTVTHWQPPRDRKLAEVVQVAREYFGPEAEHWPDDEVVHRLMIKAIDLERQIDDLKPREPIPRPSQSQYSKL